jgi:hypothetical protein
MHSVYSTYVGRLPMKVCILLILNFQHTLYVYCYMHSCINSMQPHDKIEL